MSQLRRKALWGHGAMLLFSALVAGSFSLGVEAANLVEPAALNAARFAIAAGIIFGLILAGPGLKPAQFRAPWRYGVLALFFGTYFVLMFEGLKTADPVAASAVFTLTPFMSAGFGWLLLRQVTTPLMALALSIAGAGAIWVIFRGDIQAILTFEIGQGEFIYFIGCISHAIYTPLLRKLHRGEPQLVSTFGVMTAMVLLLGVFGSGQIASTDWLSLPMIAWVAIIYLAVFASAVTFMCLQFASLSLPSAKVMAYTYLTPSWVILTEGLRGHGWPDLVILPGIAATVIALLLLLGKDD